MNGGRGIHVLASFLLIVVFAFSVIAFSGLAAAGKHYTGPTGTCRFDKSSYTVGQTMSIVISGSGGAGGTKAFFEFQLKNPSGASVMKSQMYWATSFTDTVSYTIKTSDQVGYWTGELSYNVAGKRHVVTTVIANVEVAVGH